MRTIPEAVLQKTAALAGGVTRPCARSRMFCLSGSRADIYIDERNDPHAVKPLRR